MLDTIEETVEQIDLLALSERVSSIEEKARGILPLVEALERQLVDIKAKLDVLQPDSLVETIAGRLQPSDAFLAAIDQRVADAVAQASGEQKKLPKPRPKVDKFATYYWADLVITPVVTMPYHWRKRPDGQTSLIQIVYDVAVDNPGITGRKLFELSMPLVKHLDSESRGLESPLRDAITELVGRGKLRAG